MKKASIYDKLSIQDDSMMDKYSPIATINILTRYISSALDYIAGEVIELTGLKAKDTARQIVIPLHLLLAVKNDSELKPVFLNKILSLISSNKEAINKIYDLMNPDPITDQIDIEDFSRMKAIIRHAIDCWHKNVYYDQEYCDDRFDYYYYWSDWDGKRMAFKDRMLYKKLNCRKAWNKYFDIVDAVHFKSEGDNNEPHKEIRIRFENIQLLNEVALFMENMKSDGIMSLEMCESIWNELKDGMKRWSCSEINDKIVRFEECGCDDDLERIALRLLYHAMFAKELRQFLHLQVADNYICVKCKEKGDHWIMNCSDDKYLIKKEFVHFYCGNNSFSGSGFIEFMDTIKRQEIIERKTKQINEFSSILFILRIIMFSKNLNVKLTLFNILRI